jgi:hypothetical protein
MSTSDLIHEKEETFLNYLIITSVSRHKRKNSRSGFPVAHLTEEDFSQPQDVSHQHLAVINIVVWLSGTYLMYWTHPEVK